MSSLSIGIVGLPNVGKSTLFNALTGCSVPAENYPFCTIDPSVGIVPVLDERLNTLSRLSSSKKTIPAVVEFTDIAGLVAGASKGEGLGNKFLAHIREVDAIAEVVRVFKSGDITHTHGEVNPLRDIEVINLELVLADFETVSKRRANLEKEKKQGVKDVVLEDAVLEKVEKGLDKGMLAAMLDLSAEEKQVIKHLNLLTLKPIFYVVNGSAEEAELPDELRDFFENTNARWVSLDALFEHDVSGFSGDEKILARQEFGLSACLPERSSQSGSDARAGLSDDGLNTLIAKGYELLGLVTFFTTGEDETRGWTVKRGSTAPEAGRAIHSDFHDKFIRAEVINWEALVDAGSYAAAREKGLVRTEGKEYVVEDGDVIEFRI